MLEIKKIDEKVEIEEVKGQCNDPCKHDCISHHGNKSTVTPGCTTEDSSFFNPWA